VGALLSDIQREGFVQETRAGYAEALAQHQRGSRTTERQTLAQARANRPAIDWQASPPPAPGFLGVRSFDDYPLTDLVERIDWTPFFQAWELAGRYPAILDDGVVGASARSLYEDAQAMLRRIVEERWLRARGVVGLFPANSDGAEDILVWESERGKGRTRRPRAVVHTLRQQMVKPGGRPNLALADFMAPVDSGVRDYLGMFAVTAGIGIDERAAAFKAAHDDYSAIMLKALGDRLAEAFAERLHELVRRELWGYAAAEHLDNDGLIQQRYQGIRPAPGYPACPDHTAKATIFDLLGVTQRIGVSLTESFAMHPGASVSGYCFWRPEAQYFGVGKIERDQVEDYARRKGVSLVEAERWLAPVLNY